MPKYIWYDQRFYDANPEMKRVHFLEKIWDISQTIKKPLWFFAFTVWMIIAPPAWADTVNHWPEPTIEDFEQWDSIQTLLRLEIMWIPTNEFRYYMDDAAFEYYTLTLSQESIGPVVWAILLAIEAETWMQFGWLDIPVITDLVIAKNSWDMRYWDHEFHRVLEMYPALAPNLELILTKYGCNPHGEKA